MTATLHEVVDTCSASAVVVKTGALAPTEARDVAAMSVLLPVNAALPIVDGRDIAVISGTVALLTTGSISATEGRDGMLGIMQSNAGGSSLSTLASNTARNVGLYANPDAQFNTSILFAQNITDYSGTCMDAVNKRILLFGGGHGPSQETDIRVLDLTTPQWSSLYTSTPAASMTAANLDTDKGRFISSNQPTARHTYNLTFVRNGKFCMLAHRGMPDHTDPSFGPEPNGWGGRIAFYDFNSATWSYGQWGSAYDAPPNAPWNFDSECVLDPVSQKVLIVGFGKFAGAGSLWVYDPSDDSLATGPAQNIPNSCDFIYFPPNDKFYVFDEGGTVYEITYDRTTLGNSTIVKLVTTGTPPVVNTGVPGVGMAYDSVNHLIGGQCQHGFFFAFNPLTAVWSRQTMNVEAGSSGTPNSVFHNMEFDAVSGCYVFLDGPVPAFSNAVTWAYCWNRTGSLGPSDLSVTLDFGGGSIATFSGSTAVDKGDFVGEFVRQKSYLVTNAAFPDWRVWLRTDADGSGNRIVQPATGWRDEVIVEYGRSTHGTPAHRTTSYTATITKSGSTVYSATVPNHYWYARWRYQSSQRPIVRTPATLKSRGWIPNFGTAGLYGKTTADDYSVTWPGPMGAPARPSPWFPFEPIMANGGDHEEIGYLTESGASYAIFGGSAALTTLRTQGEWTGNFCMHMRDDTTAAPLNVRDITVNLKSNGGAINDAPPRTGDASFVALDTSHFYACANMPWLLTDDPFFLEAFQYGVAWRQLLAYSPRVSLNLGGMIHPGEIRSFAWGIRDLSQLAASCPLSTPTWLQPRSYWESCLEDNRQFALGFVNSPARVHALFRSWTRTDIDEAWQAAWLSAVCGMAVDQGYSGWSTVFAWSIGKELAHTNGTSGWPRQWPVPYASTAYKDPSLWATFIQYPVPDTSLDSVTATTWTDYWNYYKSGSDGHSDVDGHPINDAGWDGHTLMAQFYDTQGGLYTYSGYPVYFLHLRSALSVAIRRGTTGAQACYNYLNGEMITTFANYGGQGPTLGEARFSIDPP